MEYFLLSTEKEDSMLCFGKAGKKPGSILLATREKADNIYWCPEEPFAEQKYEGNPLKLLDRDWLLKNVFRKYGLSRKEIGELTSFYDQDDESHYCCEGSWKLKEAFHEVERRIMTKLKTQLIDKQHKIEPHIDGSKRLSVVAFAASNSGKS